MSVPWPTGAPFGNHSFHASLNGSNSVASRRHQFAHTTLSSELPAASRAAVRFSRHWRVWSRIPPRTSCPVVRSTGPTDEM